MSYLLASAAISFAIAFFFVRQSSNGVLWGSDSDFDGPQKFHCRPVPRLGGVGIFAALAACAIVLRLRTPAEPQLALLVACTLPAVVVGLAEDLTLSIRPRTRMLAAAVSALLGTWVLQAVVVRTGISGVDSLLALAYVSIPLTVFAVAGLSHAVNIIDGFNGLASMVCMMMFCALAYVAYSVGDQFILLAALCMLGALLGFFFWNFPRGLIFLGDGGAYLVGFVLAELAVLLVHRHPAVSPWFAVLLFFYPTMETVFSIYRRKVLKGVPMSSPDASHLHSLIFRRLLHAGKGEGRAHSNPMTSLYLWVLTSLAVVPAALFWDNTPALLFFCALFTAVYLWLYQSIVRFRTPVWLLRLR
jgi:UDP-N-acetylmuramyl pentapeptide phosphotransferase/UDP-N-acetylglucosamine-1-phosphate transferase